MNKSLPLHLIIFLFLLFTLSACGNDQGNDATQGGQMMDMDPQATGIPGMENMQGMDMPGMSGMQQEGTIIPDEIGTPLLSEQGLFQVTANPQQEPVPLNSMHSWVLHVETASGQNIDNAEITVAGGMPAHMHGMPTAPAVTRSLGNGDYLVEGMQFQMPGHWMIDLNIDVEGQQDKISFNFNIQP